MIHSVHKSSTIIMLYVPIFQWYISYKIELLQDWFYYKCLIKIKTYVTLKLPTEVSKAIRQGDCGITKKNLGDA